MLNILQVTTFFTEHGGVEKSVADLSHSLADAHSVRVLCTTRGNTVRRVSGKVDVVAAGGAIAVNGRPFSPSFARELQQQTVDVVHYHLPCPMAVLSAPFVAPRAKASVATWHHDLVRHKLFNLVTHPLVDRFLDRVDSIIVTAPALIDSTPMLRRHRHKCEVIPLGIDDNRFSIIDHNSVLEIREKYGAPLVLYVGRLVYYKGCEVLIKAISRIEGAKLVMVGAGPLLGDLTQLIRMRGLSDRVHLLGWQPDDVLRNLFQSCDLFVLPSTLSTECFGLVQVEAMLCGKPVVNTQLPTGVPWVSLHSETGITVQPDDELDLTEAIGKLLGDDNLRRSMGENARRRARAMFTLDRQVHSTVELYERVLARSGSRSRPTVPVAGR